MRDDSRAVRDLTWPSSVAGWIGRNRAILFIIIFFVAVSGVDWLVKSSHHAPSSGVGLEATARLNNEGGGPATDHEHCYFNAAAYSAAESDPRGRICIGPTAAHWSTLLDRQAANISGQHGKWDNGAPRPLISGGGLLHSTKLLFAFGLSSALDVAEARPAVALFIFALGLAIVPVFGKVLAFVAAVIQALFGLRGGELSAHTTKAHRMQAQVQSARGHDDANEPRAR